MSDTILTIGAFILFVIGPFFLLYLMDRRKKTQGALFTGKPTRGNKLIAIIVGVLFGGVFFFELFFTSEVHYIFAILTVALISYGFGADQLLMQVQNKGKKIPVQTNQQPDTFQSLEQDKMTLLPKQTTRFLRKIVVIVIISAIFLLGAYWAATNPDNPLAITFVIGTILFMVLAKILDVIGLLRWFK